MRKKVVVVTGASSGIGETTAKLLAKKGKKVVLAARNESKLKAIVTSIINAGGEATYQVTDVVSLAQVQALNQKALATYGNVDVWINSAGIMPQSPFIAGQVKDWNAMIDINIKGTLNGIAAALPIMRKQKAGQFINIASVAAHLTHAGGGVYSATKAAVLMISEALRQEEAAAHSNVRVTVVSPGAINTNLVNSITDEKTKASTAAFYDKFAITPEQVAIAIDNTINLPEDASINEIIIRPTDQIL